MTGKSCKRNPVHTRVRTGLSTTKKQFLNVSFNCWLTLSLISYPTSHISYLTSQVYIVFHPFQKFTNL